MCFLVQLSDVHFGAIRMLVCLGGSADIKYSLQTQKTHRFSLSFFKCICVTVSIGKAV